MSKDKKRGTFDVVTQLVLPLISTAFVALPVARQHLTVTLSLLCVAVLSLLVSQLPRFLKWRRDRIEQKKQQSISLEALDQLTGLIQKFDDFVNISRSDGFYDIIFRKLCGANQSYTDELIPIPWQIFAGMLEHLKIRIAQENNTSSLRRYTLEFNSIVGWYSTYVVCPVYRRVPEKLSRQLLGTYLSQQLETDLIQYRERFDRFLESYSDFLRELDRKLTPPLNVGYHFDKPQPIKSVQLSDTINGV